MERHIYAGLDIGGTKCACIIGSESGNELKILERVEIPTDKNEDPYEILAKLDGALQPFTAKYHFESIGVSCGGPLDSVRGVIQCPPNLPKWDNVEICAYFSSRYNIPCKLQNDANACALAEWIYGAGQGTKNMVFCTMGTGFGAGLILDGKLYAGTSDFAGEIGHIRLTDEGPVGYGKRGSVEGYCSGGGIAQVAGIFAMERIQSNRPCGYCPTMNDLNAISAKSVAIAAGKGDEVALEVYRYVGKMLGKAMAVVVDLLNPEKIVIGSVFARSESLIRESMQHVIDTECLPGAAKVCTVVPAALGDTIGDIAAISVAINK